MSSIAINNETIALQDQAPERFRELAHMMASRLPALIEQPKEKRFAGQLPTGFTLARLGEGGDLDEPLVQVALWNLYDLGVRAVTFDVEKKTANITKSERSDCAMGRSSWISHQTVTSGRALIAAINSIAHRTFVFNEEELLVGVQEVEPMKKAIEVIRGEKKQDEAALLALARLMGKLVSQRMGTQTTEMRCLIELAAGMGLVSIQINAETSQITFRAFSEMSALATALLQGASWEKVKSIRTQLAEFSAQLGASEPTAIASYDPGAVKRRRRG